MACSGVGSSSTDVVMRLDEWEEEAARKRPRGDVGLNAVAEISGGSKRAQVPEPRPLKFLPARTEPVPPAAGLQTVLQGYDVQVEGDYDPDLMCAICQGPAIEAVMMVTCGHIFHSECLGAMPPRGYRQCPTCRQRVPVKEVKPLAQVAAARYLRNKLLALPCKCPQDCGQILPWEQIEAHIRDDCIKSERRCACGKTFLRDFLQQHSTGCPKALIECSLCLMMIPGGVWSDHRSTLCPASRVRCNYCSQEVEQGLLEEHQRQGCQGHVPVSLFLCACDRAKKHQSVHFAPLVARHFHELTGGESAPPYKKVREDLLALAENFGKAILGHHWKDVFEEEMMDYMQCSSFPIFVKDRRTVTITASPEEPVSRILDRLAAKTGARVPGRNLSYSGHVLADEDKSLWEYGVQRNSTLLTRAAGFF